MRVPAEEMGGGSPAMDPKAFQALIRRPHVVILGAGFGGLAAALRLRHADVDVTVIDRRNYHLFQPLLYQVATAGLSPAQIAMPIRRILGRQANATVLMERVEGIDKETRIVQTTNRRIAYDYLVIATGARHAYFGNEEWAETAPGLKTIGDATEIRARILSAFERAEVAENEADRERFLTFVVVGGGPTGVELAGAIAELARKVIIRDFRHIDSARRSCRSRPPRAADHAAGTLRQGPAPTGAIGRRSAAPPAGDPLRRHGRGACRRTGNPRVLRALGRWRHGLQGGEMAGRTR